MGRGVQWLMVPLSAASAFAERVQIPLRHKRLDPLPGLRGEVLEWPVRRLESVCSRKVARVQIPPSAIYYLSPFLTPLVDTGALTP